jgi:hypothetical protein
MRHSGGGGSSKSKRRGLHRAMLQQWGLTKSMGRRGGGGWVGVAATRCCFGDDGVFWWPPVISDVPCRHDGGRVMSEGRLSGKKGSEGGSLRKQRKVGAPAKF